MFKAFREGADGVFVGGCHLGNSHYESGNYKCKRRAELTEDILKELGIEKRRSRFEWISAVRGEKFQMQIYKYFKGVRSTQKIYR
ncbi:MAG TPA: hydrogenase iron-sulfur subunit [Methanobacteriales archaeon]|nr:hydrogenase iron-sulfur subunit [Methanobacteriaceae archaeon]MBC7096684.1 hydrogenase iron-sulfur subunit [Methanobacteriales archaeon]HIH61631.1 hydrogenase iron-sulfur subunit [Methanobacteriales archaeon]